MTSKEIKQLIKGKINASNIRQGDVFIMDVGLKLGKAVFAAMDSLKQSKGYKNEFHVFSTVLTPPNTNYTKHIKKSDEMYVTFAIRNRKFKDVPYLGKWRDIQDKFLNDD